MDTRRHKAQEGVADHRFDRLINCDDYRNNDLAIFDEQHLATDIDNLPLGGIGNSSVAQPEEHGFARNRLISNHFGRMLIAADVFIVL